MAVHGPKQTAASTRAATQSQGEVYPQAPEATLGVAYIRLLATLAATGALAARPAMEDTLKWASTPCRPGRFQASAIAGGAHPRHSTTFPRRRGVQGADRRALTGGRVRLRAAAPTGLVPDRATTAKAAGHSRPRRITGARGATPTMGHLRGIQRRRLRATMGPGAMGAATATAVRRVPALETGSWAWVATTVSTHHHHDHNRQPRHVHQDLAFSRILLFPDLAFFRIFHFFASRAVVMRGRLL